MRAFIIFDRSVEQLKKIFRTKFIPTSVLKDESSTCDLIIYSTIFCKFVCFCYHTRVHAYNLRRLISSSAHSSIHTMQCAHNQDIKNVTPIRLFLLSKHIVIYPYRAIICVLPIRMFLLWINIVFQNHSVPPIDLFLL